MRKEILLSAGLLISGLSGCSDTADLAANLKLQCGADPQLEIADLSVEVIPGQAFKIGGRLVKVTPHGRLGIVESLDPNLLAVGRDHAIITGSDAFAGRHYLTRVTPLEDGDKKVRIDVRVDCKNPTREP